MTTHVGFQLCTSSVEEKRRDGTVKVHLCQKIIGHSEGVDQKGRPTRGHACEHDYRW